LAFLEDPNLEKIDLLGRSRTSKVAGKATNREIMRNHEKSVNANREAKSLPAPIQHPPLDVLGCASQLLSGF
jgi:hypothetical protein